MFLDYIYWQFVESPRRLYKIFKKCLYIIANFFSIGYLLKTLFYPWKRDVKYIINPTLADQFKMMLDNLISRFMGFIMRFFTIFAGLILIIISFFVFLIAFIVWYLLPEIILVLLYEGIILI